MTATSCPTTAITTGEDARRRRPFAGDEDGASAITIGEVRTSPSCE